ncbi:retrovirus-related pol polyprotein from transposon tnt 1-94 [Gossypium australe]|uniref:Retrovirus-related pol polyprotein from transposon tnt 1-94 n=1 Tax=Gossypium australe TaxID=47621 RepID=A0A5B6UZY3_9ROSI|nr:retrovirus-related pol polyprotein from transposon tnt 1-94 [Gossypium australe]
MDSMYSNSVWELVSLPEGIKPIGCEWIYKRKRNANEKLVAKGYTKKEGINYEETFFIVAMFKSIRIFLYIAVTLDYKSLQMDVKTVFLNDYLEESIYMMRPTVYIAKGNEHKVFKLLRSIYGLKQTSCSWNQ